MKQITPPAVRKSILFVIWIVALLALGSGLPAAQPVQAATCSATSNADNGAGTVRALLADASCDTITFAGDATIRLASPLSPSRSVAVDGGTHRVTISGDTTGAELRCALDPAGPPAAFDDLPEGPCPFLGGAPVTAEGVHTFYAAAMDIWGNKSAPGAREFKIDMPPPGLTSLEVTVNREEAFAVSDPIPANTEIVRRINYDPATNRVEWSGVLEPWGFRTFTVYVRIASGAPGGTAIVNTATLADDGVGGKASATTIVKTLPPYRGHREDIDVNEVVIRGN